MGLKTLYRQYFQKSKVFLYPNLGITSHYGEVLSPAQTFISWPEKGIKPGDKKLICVYNDSFLKYEAKLTANKFFLESVETEDYNNSPSKAYIFDFKGSKKIPGDYEPKMKNPFKRAEMWLKLNEVDKRAQSLEYSMSYNWDMFLLGRYSKLSMSSKKRIKDYYRNQSNSYVYIESFLQPEKYYHLYAELLGVEVEALRMAGELTDKPCLVLNQDHGSEVLNLKIKSLKVKI